MLARAYAHSSRRGPTHGPDQRRYHVSRIPYHRPGQMNGTSRRPKRVERLYPIHTRHSMPTCASGPHGRTITTTDGTYAMELEYIPSFTAGRPIVARHVVAVQVVSGEDR